MSLGTPMWYRMWTQHVESLLLFMDSTQCRYNIYYSLLYLVFSGGILSFNLFDCDLIKDKI